MSFFDFGKNFLEEQILTSKNLEQRIFSQSTTIEELVSYLDVFVKNVGQEEVLSLIAKVEDLNLPRDTKDHLQQLVHQLHQVQVVDRVGASFSSSKDDTGIQVYDEWVDDDREYNAGDWYENRPLSPMVEEDSVEKNHLVHLSEDLFDSEEEKTNSFTQPSPYEGVEIVVPNSALADKFGVTRYHVDESLSQDTFPYQYVAAITENLKKRSLNKEITEKLDSEEEQNADFSEVGEAEVAPEEASLPETVENDSDMQDMDLEESQVPEESLEEHAVEDFQSDPEEEQNADFSEVGEASLPETVENENDMQEMDLEEHAVGDFQSNPEEEQNADFSEVGEAEAAPEDALLPETTENDSDMQEMDLEEHAVEDFQSDSEEEQNADFSEVGEAEATPEEASLPETIENENDMQEMDLEESPIPEESLEEHAVEDFQSDPEEEQNADFSEVGEAEATPEDALLPETTENENDMQEMDLEEHAVEDFQSDSEEEQNEDFSEVGEATPEEASLPEIIENENDMPEMDLEKSPVPEERLEEGSHGQDENLTDLDTLNEETEVAETMDLRDDPEVLEDGPSEYSAREGLGRIDTISFNTPASIIQKKNTEMSNKDEILESALLEDASAEEDIPNFKETPQKEPSFQVESIRTVKVAPKVAPSAPKYWWDGAPVIEYEETEDFGSFVLYRDLG